MLLFRAKAGKVGPFGGAYRACERERGERLVWVRYSRDFAVSHTGYVKTHVPRIFWIGCFSSPLLFSPIRVENSPSLYVFFKFVLEARADAWGCFFVPSAL